MSGLQCGSLFGGDDSGFRLVDGSIGRHFLLLLELHDEKTHLLEFGGYAAADRANRGEGKPETFNFLGFMHICGTTRKGKFCVLRQTMKNRMRAELNALKMEIKQRMHCPLPEQGQWLRTVLVGNYRSYEVPRNSPAMATFRSKLTRLWKQSLGRRS